jgi:hypothetical protein
MLEGLMTQPASKWWWLQVALFYVAAAGWLVVALANVFGDRKSMIAVGVSLAVVFFMVGTTILLKARPKPDDAAPNESTK